MPIEIGAEVRRLSDEEYKSRVYDVMGHVFSVHRELGRLFDERIYQREIASRVRDAQREVPVDLIFEGFCKRYFLDLLVAGGAVFEFKAVEAVTERHRRQLLHYLFLTDLPHAKLVNLRPARVEHLFVNNVLTSDDRRAFAVREDVWDDVGTGRLKDRMVALLGDWGTGLDVALYEEAAACLSGHGDREAEVEVRAGPRLLGTQRMRLVAPDLATRVTALAPNLLSDFEVHLSRFLDHTSLRAVQWINLGREVVQFKTVSRKGR